LGTSKKPFGINIKEKQVSNTITSQARKWLLIYPNIQTPPPTECQPNRNQSTTSASSKRNQRGGKSIIWPTTMFRKSIHTVPSKLNFNLNPRDSYLPNYTVPLSKLSMKSILKRWRGRQSVFFLTIKKTFVTKWRGQGYFRRAHSLKTTKEKLITGMRLKGWDKK
jgi:hypothetical protein